MHQQVGAEVVVCLDCALGGREPDFDLRSLTADFTAILNGIKCQILTHSPSQAEKEHVPCGSVGLWPGSATPSTSPLLLTPPGTPPSAGGEVVFSLKVTLGNVICSLSAFPAGSDTTLCPGKHPARLCQECLGLGS